VEVSTSPKTAEKLKIRNSKHEIRNKHEAQMTKIRNKTRAKHRPAFVLVIRILNFEIVSSFGLPRRKLLGTLLCFIAAPVPAVIAV
jgi:hypothetical protein